MSRKRDVLCCIFQAVFLFCIVFGTLCCLYLILDMEYAVSIMEMVIGIAIPFSFLCSFLYYSRESRVILIPAAVLFQCFLGYLFREQLAVYIKCVVTAGIRILNGYYRLSLPEWTAMEKIYSDDFKEGALLSAFFFMFLLSIDVIGFFRAKAAALLLGLILFFGMCVGKFPSGFFVFLSLSGILGLIPMSSGNRDFGQKWRLGKRKKAEISCTEQEERKDAPVHGETQAACFTLAFFLAALFLCSFFGKRFRAWILDFHAPIQEWANTTEYNIMNYDYGDLLPGLKNPFLKDRQQGILSNQKVEYTGKEILRVTVEKKPAEAMYLRGFVGKDYQNNSWTGIGASDSFSALAGEWGSGSEDELSMMLHNGAYSALEKEEEEPPSEITIEYLDAPGEYAYLPYFVKVSGDMERMADGAVKRQAGQKLSLKGYYEADSGWYEMLIRQRAGLYERYNRLYYDYVLDEYRSVPGSLMRLEQLCQGRDSGSLAQITEFIYRYLSQIPYSLDLKMLPYGKDFAEYFLFTQRKGYCIHFATAATLMYRLCGIPARYVEGYVIWPEDFKQNGDGTYTAVVMDDRAHAWTEIYKFRIGFVPVDMTPGNGTDGFLEEPADIAGQEAENKEENRADDTPENSEKEDGDGTENPEEEEDGADDSEEEGDGANDPEEKGGDNAKNSEEKDGEDTQDPEEENSGEEETSEKQGPDFSGSGTKRNAKTQTEGRKNKKSKAFVFIKRFLAAAVINIAILFLLVIALLRWRHQREGRKLLRGVSGKKRRKIVRLSNRLHGYIRVSGIEKAWGKSYGELSDREYGELFREKFPSLGDDYGKFQQLAQKALYAPDEEPISEEEVKECEKLVMQVSSRLFTGLSWYRRLLIKVVIGVVRH